ncbi:hypothetical protein MMC09_002628 [Bachmanniomyces sp. S44760]|nr:hypothetical protein [Bachmanniomyces sp. S44760]
MALVGYSDSEGSEAEANPISTPAPKTSTNPAKPSFLKVIERSNPHKIRVNLSKTSNVIDDEIKEDDGPPAKKARTDAGAYSGFNSFLPAPKKLAAGSGGANGSRKGGLGSGVNLKTGATPGFSREPMPTRDDIDGEDQFAAGAGPAMHQSMEATHGSALSNGDSISMENPEEKPKPQGNAMLFKPLSVAGKKKTKKPAKAPSEMSASTKQTSVESVAVKSKTKASLFSLGDTSENDCNYESASAVYKPLLYEPPQEDPESLSTHAPMEGQDGTSDAAEWSEPPQSIPVKDTDPQSLDSIAADLNLSASAKRQLLGRQRQSNGNQSSINIVNFNTDQEYAANETLRQAGEQAQHNPVRALAPGKHSLKQLVNAASNQKDALEEHFAKGKRNKNEAASKYGW